MSFDVGNGRVRCCYICNIFFFSFFYIYVSHCIIECVCINRFDLSNSIIIEGFDIND